MSDQPLYMHVFAPADTIWTTEVDMCLGEHGVRGKDSTRGGLRIARWSVPDAIARELGLAEDLSGVQPGLEQDGRNSERDAECFVFWPKLGFSSRPDEPVPEDLADGRHEEVVPLLTTDLWIHFVESADDDIRIMSFDLNDAIEGGVWGIEEGYLEADTTCDGWYITATSEPGEPPTSLHSIL